eukprot:CAMPEP_0179271098 /NCGR_PEP_ID=MMETSP0797-20121207/31800_1 /TAXON_ID=47934 /ORGANISM="Dinophysis acuminata, Strain DAEP01" /LENGTH=277 /DNA_ID=CAMNT_0020979439 /DNA_START=115 /DNA_END=945 /DNA_ORIENTATION=-
MEHGVAESMVTDGLEYADLNGNPMAYSSHRVLEPERRAVVETGFPDCKGAAQVVAVVAKASDSAELREFILTFNAEAGGGLSKASMVMGCCSIMCEDITPSECIEYAFDEAPDRWAMSQVSREALETYRAMQFERWKKMLLEPTCEAQFRRMLQIGMVARLYDSILFPTPQVDKSKYQVTDDRTGKLIELPHPVKELRIWNAAERRYDTIDTRLAGAPPVAEEAAWWKDFMGELNAKHGEEYVTGLMAGKEPAPAGARPRRTRTGMPRAGARQKGCT